MIGRCDGHSIDFDFIFTRVIVLILAVVLFLARFFRHYLCEFLAIVGNDHHHHGHFFVGLCLIIIYFDFTIWTEFKITHDDFTLNLFFNFWFDFLRHFFCYFLRILRFLFVWIIFIRTFMRSLMRIFILYIYCYLLDTKVRLTFKSLIINVLIHLCTVNLNTFPHVLCFPLFPFKIVNIKVFIKCLYIWITSLILLLAESVISKLDFLLDMGRNSFILQVNFFLHF